MYISMAWSNNNEFYVDIPT